MKFTTFFAAGLVSAAAFASGSSEYRIPVPVKNACFESGTDGWHGGKNRSPDETVAHGGRKSLRLVVADPDKDAVYATQQVPVKGGALYEVSCFVRTEDVKEAAWRMPSVGAGVIVEWADKNGKWLQSGEYACGRWGTSDWKEMKCSSLNAPASAGYAIVYLTLRGAGKAWFDDVSVTELRKPTVKIAPADGATISNNCPHFVWNHVLGIRRYMLELSRDPKFAEGNVRTIDAGGLPRYRFEKPLEPGKWYWRVSSRGRIDPDVRSFTQIAPVTADTLPPIVLTKACRVTDSGETFTVNVKHSGARLPSLSFMGVEGRYAGSDGGDILRYAFSAPKGGWPRGLVAERIVAVDAAGNRNDEILWFLNAPRPENGVIVEADGKFRQGAERIFPLGIYEVSPKYMAEVRACGYDVVHTYRWEGVQDDVACRKYLDACWAADGLRAFIGFDRGAHTKKGIVQGNLGHVARRVGALADHPGLFCWYLFDEPEIFNQFVSPDQLTEFADLIRALDPYHPVVMTTWNKTMLEYRRTWDTHWTQAYGDPAGVVRQFEEHGRFLENSSPVTLLVNCNDTKQGAARRKGAKPDPAKFARDYDHLRACAFLGIVKECNGIWWWWFARDDRNFYSASQVPKAWADLVKVVKELVSVRSVVTAEGTVLTGTAKAGKDRVEWWMKTVNGKDAFIAVNTADHPVSVEVKIPGKPSRRLDMRRYEVKTELPDNKR